LTLRESKYLALTTFRKSGHGVSTPMWFAIEGEKIYMQTNAGSWKVKRIANSPQVEVRPSDSRGKPLGEVQPGTARLHSATSPFASQAVVLLTHHYGWVFRIFNFGLWLFGRKLAYIEVQLGAQEVSVEATI
jgi:uncharacterized protein